MGLGRSKMGFTLVEITLVIAVIAIAVSFAIPNFRPLLNETRLDQAVEQFKSDLALARELAKAYGGCEVEFKLDDDAERYKLAYKVAGENEDPEKQFSGGFGYQSGFQGGTALPDDKIKLDENGSPGSDVVIEIGDEANRVTVTMLAETGRIEVAYD